MKDLNCIIGGKEENSEDKIEVKSIFGETIATVPDLSPYAITQSLKFARKSKKELDINGNTKKKEARYVGK